MGVVRQFNSMGAFATHLVGLQVATLKAAEHGLNQATKLIQEDAKARIGEYQDAAGPFPAWANLAESTVNDRISKGFSPDEPLLRTGDLRESIEREVKGLEGVVGSKSDIALYQEMGTERIPPRPFLGPAAFNNKAKIQKLIGDAVFTALTGGEIVENEAYKLIEG